MGNNEINGLTSPLPDSYYVSTWIASNAVSFLEERATSTSERPFFLCCSFTKPHAPYDPPDPYDSLYDPGELPPAIGSGKNAAGDLPHFEAQRYAYEWNTLSPDRVNSSRAAYFGNITHLDRCIGDLLSALDAAGLRDNTVIAFNADHGDLLGDHGLFFKANFCEGSTHVPLIVWVPETLRMEFGLGEPRRIDELAPLPQVLPFLVEAAGEVAPPRAEMPRLLETIRGEKRIDAVHGVYDYSPNLQLAVIEERFKYVWWQNARFEQLFDRHRDRSEQNNLAADPAHRIQKDRMRSWLVERLMAYGANEALDGDELAGADHDIASTRWRGRGGPFGRSPY